MAYVPGFEYDVFVSYASEDYDPDMAQFIEDLRRRLTRKLGKLFKPDNLFLDQTHLSRKPVEWKRELQTSGKAAALLLPFLSPCYATSDNCKDELDWFCQDPDRPLRWPSGAKELYRICPIAWEQLPERLRRQLAPEVAAAQWQDKRDAEALASKIAEALQEMRESRCIVYLGETQSGIRKEVENELTRDKFRVTPEGPGAFRDEETVRSMLSDALLAVHFLGDQDEEAKYRALRAIELSIEWARSTIVYEVPGCALEELERFALERLEEKLKEAQVYDRVTGKNRGYLVDTLRKRLEGEQPVRATPLGIACEDLDRSSAEAIIPDIRERTGFRIACYDCGGTEVLQLKQSSGVLFYWRAAKGNNLVRARNAITGRPKAFLLVTPPTKPAEEELRKELGQEGIFYQEGPFKLDDIGPFLRQLGWAG